MTPTIKNVALAGATGRVGAEVLDALIDLGFNVTVLSRSPKTMAEGITVKVVDYNSKESINEALKGQHAVIDTTYSTDGSDVAPGLIEGAIVNKVYRFITSDFGLDADLPGVHDLPVFERKKAAYESIKKASAGSGITYSLIACGPFLDFCLSSGFAGINLKEKSATLFNDGENILPWTTLRDVGRATAGVLLQPERTANRVVYIHTVVTSQKQIVETAKDVLGHEGWQVTSQGMKPLYEQALNDLQSGNITPMTFGVQIQYAIATPELAHPWPQDDNELVGIKEGTEEDLRSLLKQIALE